MYVDYDEIVREWAYRVPNGKPDLNKPYHKEKLREVLVELNYPLDLLDSPKETLNEATFTPFELAKSNALVTETLVTVGSFSDLISSSSFETLASLIGNASDEQTGAF